jgi:hypothetical protein
MVREYLYVPDGQPPAGWSVGRCGSILKRLMNQGYSSNDLEDAIEGLALMRDRGELDWCTPRTKLTMKALYNTRHGVRPLLAQAQETLHGTLKRKVAPPLQVGLHPSRGPADALAEHGKCQATHISETIDRLVPRKP